MGNFSQLWPFSELKLTQRWVSLIKQFLICERFEPRSHFISKLSMIVQVNLVPNRTAVDSDWRFDNLYSSLLQTKFTRTILLNLLMKFVICCSPFKMWMSAKFVTPARMEPLVSTPWVDTAAGALQITRENTAMKVRKIGIIFLFEWLAIMNACLWHWHTTGQLLCFFHRCERVRS